MFVHQSPVIEIQGKELQGVNGGFFFSFFFLFFFFLRGQKVVIKYVNRQTVPKSTARGVNTRPKVQPNV